MNHKLISFIIPVYNAEEYIENCLDSILELKHITKEIITIDDGSKDASVVILKKYQEKYEEIILLEQDHGGASAARNMGLKAATGEWVCFVDSDDYLVQDLFQSIDLNSVQEDVVFFDYQKDSTTKVTPFCYSKNEKHFTKEECEILQRSALNKNKTPKNLQVHTPWAKIYRRAVLMEHDLCFTPGIRKSEDLLFNFEVYHYVNGAVYYPYMGYGYRYNPNSLTNTYTPDIVQDYKAQQDRIKMLLERWDCFDAYKSDYFVRGTVNFLFAMRADYLHPNNTETYANKKAKFKNDYYNLGYDQVLKQVDRSNFSLVEKVFLFASYHKLFGVSMLLNKAYLIVESLVRK